MTPEYRGVRLVDIPSGLGGVLPAAVARESEIEMQVICLHPDFYTDWVFTVMPSETKPMTYQLTPAMRAIIDRRKGGRRALNA